MSAVIPHGCHEALWKTVANKDESNIAQAMFDRIFYISLSFQISHVHSRLDVSHKPEIHRSEIRATEIENNARSRDYQNAVPGP
ncbi:hypothetical protein TNIN_270881 [Trichonephila inaurata madagascariensis]|uniref:Uncharacterized protein n=1 Tax=Trichonephila inaurata madagascariensis TaxID=2747483 RepID=A0A8X6WWN4_9ARAC|nr:hypothetical protein TNIN_270881 [Trichonephila inaurata madagascariensis]